ncbi:MAG: hypothetical protein QOG85_859 [Gaiellaceae bacterium]|jgi:hypothetical protein|nr:hypothetical protein [Gaiellaceae bacterium]
MTDRKRPPDEINRALAEHQRDVLKRQSDHEIKVGDDLEAMVRHLRKREELDRDVVAAIGVLADELGAADRLPAHLRAPTPTGAAGAAAAGGGPPRPPAVHENARKSAQAASGTYVTLGLLVLELAIEVARHL